MVINHLLTGMILQVFDVHFTMETMFQGSPT